MSTVDPSSSFSPSLPEEDTPESSKSNRFSIDESVELEHALNNTDSAPVTPANPQQQSFDQPDQPDSVAGLHFDPGVLAHIITQLRQQIKDITVERDALQRPSEEAEYSEALQHMTDKATRLEEELGVAKRQNQEDADAISLLRTKVEESRRGLMRLQSENRRQSQHGPPSTLDMSRAGSFLSSNNSSKRQSFTPLTGTLGGHRRTSSIGAGGSTSPRAPTFDIHPASPNGQVLTFPDTSSSTTPPQSSRRLSSLFTSPSRGRSVSPEVDPEVEALRREVKNLKDTLEETRAELSEAVEGKEASDVCAKALREFIEANNVGSDKLPPLPISKDEARASTGTGWGFGKLFRQPPAVDTSVATATTSSAAPSPSSASATPQAPPLSQKIGSFFSRSNSISSTASITGAPLQSNAAASRPSIEKRESTYSFSASDASSVSVLEPISPVGEEDGDDGVRVREGSEEGSPRQPEGKVPPSIAQQPLQSVVS